MLTAWLVKGDFSPMRFPLCLTIGQFGAQQDEVIAGRLGGSSTNPIGLAVSRRARSVSPAGGKVMPGANRNGPAFQKVCLGQKARKSVFARSTAKRR